jgi:hypothetical protein
MPNALQMSTPPAPNPDALQSQPPSPQPIGSGSQGQPPGASPQAQQAPPPPPTHQQTVAALRHFDAIEQELTALLKDPDCGKADMKSKMIDGMTTLVGRRIVTPASAVMQLGSVPDRPYDQKMFLQNHLQQTMQAAAGVLDHHAQGFAGQSVSTEPPNPDDHIGTMAGLAQQYKGAA